MPVAVNIEQNLAFPVFLPDLQRQYRRVRIHERLGNGLGCLKYFVKFPLRLDRRQDVQTLASRRLDERMVAETLEMLFEFQSKACDIRKLEILRRVEVVHDVIRLVKMRRARMHLVQFDARQVRQPDERCFFGCDNVILLFFAERHVLDPLGRPIRSVFLKERLPADAVRIPHQRQWPPFQVQQNRRRNFEVIFNELRFDDVVVGKKNFRQIRKFNLPFANLGYLSCARGH